MNPTDTDTEEAISIRLLETGDYRGYLVVSDISVYGVGMCVCAHVALVTSIA